jgi:hypothetical protein
LIMAYGDWVKHQGDDAPEQAAQASTESETPATARAQGQFGLYAIVSFFLGFVPGLQGLWVFTALCVLALLVSPTVGSLEASSKEKARSTGGGGCDVVLAGLILLALAVGSVLVLASMAGGS